MVKVAKDIEPSPVFTIITKVGKKDIYYSAHTSNRFNHSLKKRLKKGTIERICILVMKDSAT